MGIEHGVSREEMKAANDTISEEQRALSLAREQRFRQPKEALELREPQLNEHGERQRPTTEQVVEMDRRLSALQDLMRDTNIRWQIDGALAISAYNGEYLGYHKDVDLSIEMDDVEELQRRAIAHGYGLFMGELYRDSHNETQYAIRPASREQFLAERHHRFLIRVDGDGKIQNDGGLDFIDIHLRPRTAEGRELGAAGISMPKEWDETTVTDFHQIRLNLPSLAKVAYFKLYADRPVDVADVLAIARSEHFTDAQLGQLVAMLAAERADALASMRHTLDEAADAFRPEMTLKEMQQLFLEDSGSWTRVFKDRASYEKFAAMFFEAAQKDLETAKDMVYSAAVRAFPHRREDIVAAMTKARQESA